MTDQSFANDQWSKTCVEWIPPFVGNFAEGVVVYVMRKRGRQLKIVKITGLDFGALSTNFHVLQKGSERIVAKHVMYAVDCIILHSLILFCKNGIL